MNGEAYQSAPAAAPMQSEAPQEAAQVTEHIWRCADGAYRWAYEYDMLRNPTILFTIYKVLGIAWGAVVLLDLILALFDGNLRSFAALWSSLRIFLLIAAGFLVLGALGYLITAAILGWRYQVLFEMTDEYVKHIQLEKQVKKADAIGAITLFVGLVAKNFATAGAGVLAMTKSESVSVFKNVDRIKVRRNRHTIHVNQLLEKNQVYAEDADFDFVEQFIREHCVKAKER